jgi:hypothetical protein
MKKMYIFFLLLIVSIFYLSCRREFTLSNRNESKINLAKEWFFSYQKTTLTQSVFKNIRYHWDKANVFTYENGYQVITVPVTQINQNPNYKGKRSLYLFPWKNGKGYYTTLFEFLPEENHLKEHNGNFDLKTYDGIIASWDLKMGFTAGLQYKKGIVSKRVNILYKKKYESVTQSLGSPLPGVTVTAIIPAANWGAFWVTLMNSFGFSSTILWSGRGDNNPCEYEGCNNNDLNKIFDTNAFTEPENNDDNDGKAEVQDITKNVDDPCLSATLDAAIDDNLSNNINEILQNTFNCKTDLNINFLDEDLNNPIKDANTQTISNGKGRLDFNVTLNIGVLPEASKEFTAATIYHEIVHAYLRTGGLTDRNLHEIVIAEKYQSQIESSLHSLFPNISDLDAKALSWGGLMETPAWDKFKTANPKDALDLEVANSKHRIHDKGTPCN